MQTHIIYIDILICVNLFVNYFLLLAVAGITKCAVCRKRLALGAFCGAVFSVTALFDISKWLFFPLRILICAITVFAAFGYKSLRLFLRRIGLFFAVTFIFAGIMMFIFSLLGTGGTVKNSVVYFNVSPVMLIGATVVCHFALCVFKRLLKSRYTKEKTVCAVKVQLWGKETRFNALCDTANLLTEFFSGYPVIVVSAEAVSTLFEKDELEFLSGVQNRPPPRLERLIRVIPCASVTGSTLLRAFKPQTVTVFWGERQITVTKIYIAVSAGDIAGGEYCAVINPDAFN